MGGAMAISYLAGSYFPKKYKKNLKNCKTKDYFVNIVIPTGEMTLDYDDLICISHQLIAIGEGWAWPITVFFKEEPIIEKKWTWK